tara:strand:- start:497 stop:1195 length:699 start_codon:yes stop_codon:yes gene_type:complete
MNTKNICVFDFETDSPKPDTCNPVQLGAIMVHPIKLTLIDSAEFCSDMRPLDFDEPDYAEKHKDTIEWHAKTAKCTTAEVLKRWDEAPPQKDVWTTFLSWLSRYHTKQDRQTIFTAPIAAGYNIFNFDLKIINRLSTKYGNIQKDGTSKVFFPRDKIDIIHQVFYWFENQQEPKSYTMDSMREYFGMSNENAHDALQDVKDEAEIMIRFMRAQRWLTQKLLEQGKLKGGMKK